jgi:DNA-binding CsgD family transcriptional regulator/N-acetylneuraminic acid mutarotase
VSEEQTPLSDREIEIMRLVATGATNQEIARKLYISVNTVKVHLRNIYVKLDVASRTEATMYAVRQGWVNVPRLDEGAKEALEPEAAPLLPSLPRVDPWPRVSLAKRIALVAAILLALLALVLPPVLQGKGNGTNGDPIGGVFPTEATGASTTRWRTRAQMPTPRTDLAVVADEGLIYAIGGVSNEGVTGRVEVYDPGSDAWTTRRSKPTPVGFASAAEVGGMIYVPGGFDAGRQPLDVLEVYDPAQDIWQARAPLPRPLGAYGLAALDGKIYLFGGRDKAGYVASTYRYDPEADAWEELQPMDQARGFLGAAAIQDRIYVVGGYDDVTEFRTCEVYDPAADRWARCAPMDMGRGGLVLVPVREYLYAIGGGMEGYLAFNERYDPRSDNWRRFETPVTEQWRGLGAASVYPQLYAIGGWNGDFLSVNEAYQALYQIILPSIGQ